ncbi:MAG: AraC family transcriptional regulator [Prolixibacteraceae bacterium]
MKKQDGFPGQLSYVIPDRILALIRQNPMCEDLYLTDIGYYPRASHHFRERKEGIGQTILIYNVQGIGTIKVADQEFKLAADHFFIIPEGIPHAYSADLQDPWSIYWIHISGSKAKQIAKPILQPVSVLRSKDSRINERIELFNEIFRNLERGFSNETLEYINLCLPRLLATFTHLTQYRSNNEQLTKNPVSQSINFMLENLSMKFSLKELATVVNLSASHYSRLFLSRTGHSPIDYFIQLKIQRSCRLLDNTKLIVAEVARETGFEDQFYFSRQFRRVMNMSPREYRKR